MKVCVRCGKELTKHQRKYCFECGYEASKEISRKCKKARRERGKADTSTEKPQENDHMIWEANICLNCIRGHCVNCLEKKTHKEKEEMLEKSGGRKWLD